MTIAELREERRGEEMSKIIIGLLLVVFAIPSCAVRGYKSIIFERGVGGNLKRAADANTINLAQEELSAALKYIEANGLTVGYTSIIYRTPDEDVSFWYRNLSASLDELRSLPTNATSLEKSNMLMKLRETLLDTHARGVSVTAPDGISVFPNNMAYAIWLAFSALIGCAGVCLFLWGIEDM